MTSHTSAMGLSDIVESFTLIVFGGLIGIIFGIWMGIQGANSARQQRWAFANEKKDVIPDELPHNLGKIGQNRDDGGLNHSSNHDSKTTTVMGLIHG